MNIVLKVLAGLGLLGIAFAAGWLVRPPEVRTETKVEVVEKEVVKVVKQLVTTGPDGVTTTQTETTTTTTDTTTTTPVVPAPVAAATVRRRDWSVGVSWQPDWRDRTWLPAQGEVGYRAVGDLWVVGAYNWKENHALLGVRYEF